MSDDESEARFHDPETGERVDITPGADTPDALYHDVDPEYDYEEASETWLGEPASVELRIETIGSQVKRFLLCEPDDDEQVDRMILAILDDNQFSFCKHGTAEPDLTMDLWRNGLTARERKLYFDHVYSWHRFSEFITMQERVADADEQFDTHEQR